MGFFKIAKVTMMGRSPSGARFCPVLLGFCPFFIFWSTAMAKTINGEVQIHTRVDGKEIVITESSVRRDLQLADEEDKAVYKELGDRLVVVLGAKKAWGILLLKLCLRVYLNIPMIHCSVLEFEKTKTSQRNEIDSLKRRVKKLEKRNRSRTHNLKRLYKVGLTARVESSDNEESLGEDASKHERRMDAIDVDNENTLVNDADNEMFDVDDLGGKSTTTTTITIVIISLQHSHDKGKGIMIEEPVKPKKKDQIRLDEEAALKLQANAILFNSGISLPQQGEPFFTSSEKVFWQWELITGSGNALSILFLTILP
nr:hypothetical protein [Tanacetum cinerariifolium]